jgi:hypothetical protein
MTWHLKNGQDVLVISIAVAQHVKTQTPFNVNQHIVIQDVFVVMVINRMNLMTTIHTMKLQESPHILYNVWLIKCVRVYFSIQVFLFSSILQRPLYTLFFISISIYDFVLIDKSGLQSNDWVLGRISILWWILPFIIWMQYNRRSTWMHVSSRFREKF